MNDRKRLGTGSTCAVICGICCFTPALVVLLSSFGLSAWLVWSDFVLIPALLVSLVVVGIALTRMRRRRATEVRDP